MAKIIVVSGLKGGSGKSRLAQTLAIGMHELGLNPGIIDIDAGQRSTLGFVKNRRSQSPELWRPRVKAPDASKLVNIDKNRAQSRTFLTAAIRDLQAPSGSEKPCDAIIIDCPGTGTGSYLGLLALQHADVLLTPVPPGRENSDVILQLDGRRVVDAGPFTSLVWDAMITRMNAGKDMALWLICPNVLDDSLGTKEALDDMRIIDSFFANYSDADLPNGFNVEVLPAFSYDPIHQRMWSRGVTVFDPIVAKNLPDDAIVKEAQGFVSRVAVECDLFKENGIKPVRAWQ